MPQGVGEQRPHTVSSSSSGTAGSLGGINMAEHNIGGDTGMEAIGPIAMDARATGG